MALIEKAFAKLKGCYEAIESGKVHKALTYFIPNAITEEFGVTSLALNASNPGCCDVYDVWRKLKASFSSGVHISAGLLPRQWGQSATFNLGHALSVQNLYDAHGEKLIQFMDPFGSNAIEFDGDWSDESLSWTNLWRKRLGQPLVVDSVDGKFWMSYYDFLEYFRVVNLCRSIVEGGRKSVTGTMTESNNCVISNVGNCPQYILKSTVPVNLFLHIKVLAEKRKKKNSLTLGQKSEPFIEFYVLKAKQKPVRFQKFCRSHVVDFCLPSNSGSTSKEMLIDNPYQAFIIVCATDKPVDVTFALTVSASAKAQVGNISLEKLE